MVFPKGFSIGLMVSPAAGTDTSPPGGPAEIPVNAVTFDGTNDYLLRGAPLTGIVDSKTGIFSAWVKQAADGSAGRLFVARGTTVNDIDITLASDGKLQIIAKNAAGSNVIFILGGTATLVADGWTHLLCAWDLSVPVFHMYRTDVEDIGTTLTLLDDTIDYTEQDWSIGAGWLSSLPGNRKFDGDMAEVYFQDGEFLDLSEEINRRLFISAGGKPVDLGADGSNPTGTQPIVYMTGATSTWHTTKGSGGGFTEVGALTNASSSPSD